MEPVAVMVNFFQLHQLELGGAPIKELHRNGESSLRFTVLVNLDQVELECLVTFRRVKLFFLNLEHVELSQTDS